MERYMNSGLVSAESLNFIVNEEEFEAKCDSDCDFCLEFSGDDDDLSRQIEVFRNEYILLATLGCFREGYCLYMPISHELSFATLGSQRLVQVEDEIEMIRRKIMEEYSTFVILAEHGPGINNSGASCCDHAHMHLIPVNNPRSVFMKFYQCSPNLQMIGKLADLDDFQDEPYIYLSCGKGQHFVWKDAAPFGRQFVRQVCAELDGIGPFFNWRVNPFHENIKRTAERLRLSFNHDGSV